MKYQFTTEGSKSQTKYNHIRIISSDDESKVLFECVVSTPIFPYLLMNYLKELLEMKEVPMVINLVETYGSYNGPLEIIGLDMIARILSNIKPLKQKVVITICGEKKTYELDADKLETLLKSLE